jgi:hypothetical protein
VTLLVRASLPSARFAWIAACSAVLFFLATALEAHGPAAPPASAIPCMVVTSVLLAVPFVLGALSLRHAFPTGARGRAASLGVAAGLLGAAVIRLHCPRDDAFHVMLGHGLPIALAGLVGLAVHRILRA